LREPSSERADRMSESDVLFVLDMLFRYPHLTALSLTLECIYIISEKKYIFDPLLRENGKNFTRPHPLTLCIKILREDIAISRAVKSPGTWFFMLGDNDAL
jgi:hypothetical protein